MSGADMRAAQSLQCAHKCDVACFFYDASVVSAFEYAASIHVRATAVVLPFTDLAASRRQRTAVLVHRHQD